MILFGVLNTISLALHARRRNRILVCLGAREDGVLKAREEQRAESWM